MRARAPRRAALWALSLLGLLLPGPALASQVVAFGDSWASGAAPVLAQALSAAGLASLSVDDRGVPGSTAEHWAVVEPMALANAVSANADAQWVWLSIGGNDVIELQMAGQGAQAASRNDMHIRSMLDALFLAHPDIKVVMFGYDYTNFQQSQVCLDQADSFFHPGVTQAEINQLFVNDVGNVMATIAADYENVSYVPIWGAMQIAGGGAANANQPSPVNMMFDCFHPNPTGYRAVMDALVTRYWGAPRPSLTMTPQRGSACVGDRQLFTAQGTNVSRYAWQVNGQAVGSGASHEVVFNRSGGISVQVEGVNMAWSDFENQVVSVSSCNDAGVLDMGVPDVGTPDSGPPDSGVVDSGTIDSGSVDAGVIDSGSVDSGPIGPADTGVIADATVERPQIKQDWDVGGGCSAMGVASHRSAPKALGLVFLPLLTSIFSSSWRRRSLLLRRP